MAKHLPLCILLLVTTLLGCKPGAKKKPARPAADSPTAWIYSAVAATPDRSIVPAEGTWQEKNPFARAWMQQRLASLKLEVEGVSNDTNPVALVSGRVVRPGDRIGAHLTVASVNTHGVSLRGAGAVLVDLELEQKDRR